MLQDRRADVGAEGETLSVVNILITLKIPAARTSFPIFKNDVPGRSEVTAGSSIPSGGLRFGDPFGLRHDLESSRIGKPVSRKNSIRNGSKS